MGHVRHTLIALLALLGLMVATQPISARATCTMDAIAAMPTMNHHSRTPVPMNHEAQTCPVCFGVLPSLPVIEPHVLPPVALFAGLPHTLSGIDPALDPPPPRAA
jgi:hypothetical protein